MEMEVAVFYQRFVWCESSHKSKAVSWITFPLLKGLWHSLPQEELRTYWIGFCRIVYFYFFCKEVLCTLCNETVGEWSSGWQLGV